MYPFMCAQSVIKPHTATSPYITDSWNLDQSSWRNIQTKKRHVQLGIWNLQSATCLKGSFFCLASWSCRPRGVKWWERLLVFGARETSPRLFSLHKCCLFAQACQEDGKIMRRRERERKNKFVCTTTQTHTQNTECRWERFTFYWLYSSPLKATANYLRRGEEEVWSWYFWKGDRAHYLFFF